MLNGKTLQDEKTKKWGYTIYTGNPYGTQEVKILKEFSYTFISDEEATKELKIELKKFNNTFKYSG